MSKRFTFGGSYLSISAECQAWLAVLPSQPSDSFITTIDNYIFKPLVANGIFTLLDRLWIGAQEVEAHGQYSLVNPATTPITLTNSPTWTQYEGWAGNASNTVIDSNYNASTQGVNFTQNSASFGFYRRDNNVGAYVECGGAANVTVSSNQLSSRYTGNLAIARVNNSSGAGALSVSNSDSRGLFSGVRTASNALAIYKNGSSIGSNTYTSSAVPNTNIHFLSFYSAGTDLNFSNAQLSIMYFGSGTISQSTFSSILNSYMTQLGKNVY